MMAETQEGLRATLLGRPMVAITNMRIVILSLQVGIVSGSKDPFLQADSFRSGTS